VVIALFDILERDKMFSPNVIEVSENIAGAHAQFLSTTGFLNGAIQTHVSPLSPDPLWLTPLRDRMQKLRDVGHKWQIDAPKIETSYYQSFIDYSALISGVAETIDGKNLSNPDLLDLLNVMRTQLLSYQKAAKTSEADFTKHLDQISSVESLLNQSLTTAWNELALEEQAMVRIAVAITSLQDEVDQLQDSLTSAEISSGKSYFQTAATISYTLVTTAGEEIPFLSIVSEVYTIGKMAYDLIVTDKKIDEAIDKIVELRVEATEAAQAVAMAKGIVHLINNFEKRMAGMAHNLPAIDQMWEAEAGKIGSAIDAINKGADPTILLDIVTMNAAAATWQSLAQLAQNCIISPVKHGKQVLISTDRSVASA
jgi:hypothetical protein